MKVFEGRLVHSVGAHEDIQVLERHLIAVDDSQGKVRGVGCGFVVRSPTDANFLAMYYYCCIDLHNLP